MSTMTYTGALTVLSCGHCSIRFAVPSDFDAIGRQEGRAVWCPAGHQMRYGEDENARLRRQLAGTVAELDQANAEASYQERRARSLKGVVTKTKQRIAKGSCPCCSSSFPDLAAHMTEAHPEYTAAGSGVMEEGFGSPC
jgi:hypothetical protein